MTPAPTLRALTGLLDTTIEEILDAARPRTFNRLAIATAADAWDNSVPALLHAVTAPTAAVQEERAVALVRWMGTVRPGHHGWFRTMGLPDDVAAHFPEEPPRGPYRDYAERVRPITQELTTASWTELAHDYDLTAGTVEYVTLTMDAARPRAPSDCACHDASPSTAKRNPPRSRSGSTACEASPSTRMTAPESHWI